VPIIIKIRLNLLNLRIEYCRLFFSEHVEMMTLVAIIIMKEAYLDLLRVKSQ